jgi:hypothetical protein
MQILTKNNLKFKKLSRNPSYRIKVKILGNNFWIAHQENLVPRMLTSKMFEHRNSGKNRRERIELFFKN